MISMPSPFTFSTEGTLVARGEGLDPAGLRLSTRGLQSLIDRAGEAGGGRVVVPPGRYRIGSIFLRSGVDLHLAKGATLVASEDPADFPLALVSWEGADAKGHTAVVTAADCENAGLSGDGEIDGSGAPWWRLVREKRLSHPRPRLVHFIRCSRMSLTGITLRNSASWTIHPYRCRDVRIEGVSIFNPADSPNTDGINPESSQWVTLRGCLIDVGDDCIAIKAGTEHVSDPPPTRNILIEGCILRHGHGGVVLGSEMSGGIERVLVKGCLFEDTDRGIRLKTRRGRGGYLKNLVASGLIMNRVGTAFAFNSFYKCGTQPDEPQVLDRGEWPVDATTPRIEGIRIRDVLARSVRGPALWMYGLPESPIRDLSLRDVEVSFEEGKPFEPDMTHFTGKMGPAAAVLCHVDGVSLSDCRFGACEVPRVSLVDAKRVEGMAGV